MQHTCNTKKADESGAGDPVQGLHYRAGEALNVMKAGLQEELEERRAGLAACLGTTDVQQQVSLSAHYRLPSLYTKVYLQSISNRTRHADRNHAK